MRNPEIAEGYRVVLVMEMVNWENSVPDPLFSQFTVWVHCIAMIVQMEDESDRIRKKY